MYFAMGTAAGAALDLLSSLVPAKSTAKTGVTQNGSGLFDIAGTSGTPFGSSSTPTSSTSSTSGTLSPATFNALLAAQDPSKSGAAGASDALKSLFAQIDGNGDGKITKAEFEDKLGAGGTNIQAADNVFNKMDTDNDGSVSLDEMASALKGKGGAPHAHQSGAGGGGGGGGAAALMEALQAASSTSTTNSDGSVTTTMTYADGTTLTLSQAAPSTPASDASSKYNLVEQMVQRQTDALAAAAKSVSVKV